MNNKNFRIGTIVVLNSGGPGMTVISDRDDRGLHACAWFDSEDRVISDVFPPEALTEPKDIQFHDITQK